MHTITTKAAANALGVPLSQVYLMARRGIINTKTGLDGGTRVHMDADWHRAKKHWTDPNTMENNPTPSHA